jgi:hypothetical protein
MKWLLVVLVGGVSPIQTDLVFEKLSDCLAAEEQLRQTYAEALVTLSQRAAIEQEQLGRHARRDRYRMRESESRRFANSGTCVPHSGTDRPITSLGRGDQSNSAPSSQPTASPQPSPSPSERP